MIRRFVFFVVLAGIASAAYSAGVVKTDAELFGQASEEAGKFDENKQIKEYRRKLFYPRFGPLLNGAMNECLAKIKNPTIDPFSFVLTLDKKGNVTQIVVEKSTDVSDCVTERLATITYPVPPVAPFLEKVDMKINP